MRAEVARSDAYWMKVLPTQYLGVTFRSRTEARWAVAFEYCCPGKWVYEPEGFELPCGPYLPDFQIGDWYLEVKPLPMVGEGVGLERMDELVRATRSRGLVLYGTPWNYTIGAPIWMWDDTPGASEGWWNPRFACARRGGERGLYVYPHMEANYHAISPDPTDDGERDPVVCNFDAAASAAMAMRFWKGPER